MNNKITTIMNVKENKVGVMRTGDIDYILLTDLARYQIQVILLLLLKIGSER